MSDEGKMIELLNQIIDGGFKWHSHLYESGEQLNNNEIASHLLANGVTIRKRRSWVRYAFIACYVVLAVLSALSAGMAPNLFGQVVDTLLAVAYILAAVFTAMEE